MYILQRTAWLFRRLLGQLLFASLLCAAAALFKTLYAMQLSAFLDALIATSVFSGHLLLMGAGLLALHVLVHICAENQFASLQLRAGYLLNEHNAGALSRLSVCSGLSQGDILASVNSDSKDFLNAMTSLLRGSLVTLLTTSVVFAILCTICWQLAAVALVVPVGYNLCVLKFSGRKQAEQAQEREKMHELSSCAEDALVNRLEARVFRLSAPLDARHARLLAGWDATRRILSRFWSCVGACDALLYLGYRLLLVMLGTVFASQGKMTLGDILVFLTLANTFMNFIWDFQAESYRNAIAAAQKLLAFWEAPAERTGGEWTEWNPEEGLFLADHLSYAYPGAEPVLQEVSFAVRKGEFLGILGESGCGKTTLLHLLCGFLDASGGKLLAGGTALSQWNLESLRGHLAYMEQHTSLIRGTLWENVALREESTLTEQDRQKIRDILRAVGLDYLLKPQQQTQERLSQLSQGELQRVGFVRCLFKGAKVWLLDELTSALDADTEAAILELMRNIHASGIAMAAVTHRKALMPAFDRAISLRDGRAVELPLRTTPAEEG